jgi:hypothetical protein
MSSSMVVIKIGKSPLHLAAIRQGVGHLMSQNVQRFNDGRYHVTLSPAVFQKLIDAFSEADAVNAGFERIDDSAVPRFFFAGLRWEIDSKATDLRIFGPKSDVVNPYVIDLVEQEGQYDNFDSRPNQS